MRKLRAENAKLRQQLIVRRALSSCFASIPQYFFMALFPCMSVSMCGVHVLRDWLSLPNLHTYLQPASCRLLITTFITTYATVFASNTTPPSPPCIRVHTSCWLALPSQSPQPHPRTSHYVQLIDQATRSTHDQYAEVCAGQARAVTLAQETLFTLD